MEVRFPDLKEDDLSSHFEKENASKLTEAQLKFNYFPQFLASANN
jgi:hypothetical protein